ncbi:efflux RND transporter periplasmic adaptor subunit [Stenotrophomonas pictorum]|nr:efflux RND transporter periplasmic adaptor subunit [Stenotrophomonas pictorum]
MQAASLGIKTESAASTDTVALTQLPAEAMPPLAASTQVTVPYAGIVIRILADEGQRVRRGQPLLRLQSRDLLVAQADVQRARSQAAVADQQARRDVLLADEGIIPVARREQSLASAAIARASRLQAEGMLSQLRVVSSGSPGEYDVLAPQDGLVLRRSASPGQAMEAMAPAYVIADATRMDIMFSAPTGLREQLRPGLEVTLPGGESARVVSVSGDTDRNSQRLRVRAQTDEGSALMAGQQFAVVLKLPAPAGALRVPRSALLPHRDQHLLYVQHGDLYRGVIAESLGHDDTHAVVVSPSLQPGMPVVSRGISVLKSLAPLE